MHASPELGRVKVWAWALLCAGAVALFVATGLGGPLSSIAATVFLVALPALALAQGTVSAQEIAAHRVSVYASSAVVLALLAALAWWAWPSDGGGVREWLAWPGSILGLLGAVASLTAAGIVIFYGFRALGARRGWQEPELVRAVIPASSRERGAFAALSIAAGVCEEIVYRGYAPIFLMPWCWDRYLLAALPVSAFFGILHAYQGTHGMVRAGATGMVLAVGVAWTGSLLPSILAHAAINLLIGLVLADSILGGTQTTRR